MWRKLWNLKIPPKIKNFLWHASAYCLTTKDLLRIRRVQVDPYCPTCNECPETIIHYLVNYSYAKSCWIQVHGQSVNGEFSSFWQWLRLVFQQQGTYQILISVTFCWMIWKHRNDLVWNQHCLKVSEVVESAYSILHQ